MTPDQVYLIIVEKCETSEQPTKKRRTNDSQSTELEQTVQSIVDFLQDQNSILMTFHYIKEIFINENTKKAANMIIATKIDKIVRKNDH
jgi:hypothetical protein